jgi:hypothetical protein
VARLERAQARLLKGRRSKGSRHPDEYTRYTGESHLLVWCSWRIDDAKGPLASSDSEFELCESAVERLIGKTVRNVRIGHGWDLRLDLSSGWVVSVFPDHVGPESSFDGNWELWRPEQAYLVGTDLACEVIDRENRPLRPLPRAGRWQVGGTGAHGSE